MYLFGVRFTSFELWSQMLNEPLLSSWNYFRPISLLSFVLQIQGHGPDPFTLHLLNLILHAMNTFMVGVLALNAGRSMGDKRKSGWIIFPATLVYGLHPSHVEVVAWTSGRFDLMVTAFLLLALLADSFLRNIWLRSASVGLFFFVAAASKEMAIAFPLVLFVWHLAMSPRAFTPVKSFISSFVQRGEFYVYIGILIGGLAYLYWRYTTFGYIYTSDTASDPNSFITHVLLAAKSLGFYLLATVYPYSLTAPVHPLPPIMPTQDTMAWVALFSVVIFMGILVWLVRKAPRQGWAWVAYLLCYLPVIHLFPMTTAGNYVHDRYMYFPLVFFTFASTISLSAFFSLSRPQGNTARAALVGSILFITIWSAVHNWITIPIWGNEAALWKWAVYKQPDSFLAHSNLSGVYYSQRKFQESMDEGLRALELNQNSSSGWFAVGNALMGMGRYEEALTYHQTAMEISPKWLDLVSLPATSLIKLGRYSEAEKLLLSAHEKGKSNRPINMSLTVLYESTGKKKLADQYFELATRGLSAEVKMKYRVHVENELHR